MSEDLMQYEKMTEDALRQVVRHALARAQDGLPGEHHFFIAFKTDFPGVELTPFLRETYPDDMTIALQHRFWNLDVQADYFSVELTFNNVLQKLKVPYAAVKTFYDPSVEFGLQFHVEGDEEEGVWTEGSQTSEDDRPEELRTTASGETAGGNDLSNESAEAPSQDNPGDVVSLDAFRKK